MYRYCIHARPASQGTERGGACAPSEGFGTPPSRKLLQLHQIADLGGRIPELLQRTDIVQIRFAQDSLGLQKAGQLEFAFLVPFAVQFLVPNRKRQDVSAVPFRQRPDRTVATEGIRRLSQQIVPQRVQAGLASRMSAAAARRRPG